MFRRNCQNADKFLDWNRDFQTKWDLRIDIVCVSISDIQLYFLFFNRCRFRTFTSLPLLLFAFSSSCTWHSFIIAPYAITIFIKDYMLTTEVIREHLFFCNKSLSVVRFTEASYQMWAFSKHRSTNLENNVDFFPDSYNAKS
jgi:hypothetical protein